MGDINAVVLVVIHQPSRGGYHDLAALGQTLCLLFHIGTAVHTGHLHLGHKVGEVGQLLGARAGDEAQVGDLRLVEAILRGNDRHNYSSLKFLLSVDKIRR